MNRNLLFDWGDTLMKDNPQCDSPMAFWENVEPMPEVMGTMPILHDKYRCVVVSNAKDSNAELMQKAFERIKLNRYFHEYITSKELGATKPNPAFFQGVLAKYQLVLSETIMIGNDYEKDITGAKAVGLKTIFITSKQGEFPNADYIIPSFGNIVDIL
jgi:putative hydrolase of the HAD superfamily